MEEQGRHQGHALRALGVLRAAIRRVRYLSIRWRAKVAGLNSYSSAVASTICEKACRSTGGMTVG